MDRREGAVGRGAAVSGRRRWGIAVVAVVLVVVGAVAVGLARIGRGLDEAVTRVSVPPAPVASRSSGVAPPARPPRPASAGDALNILVVRTDAAADSPRADLVGIAHVGDRRTRVDLVTLPPALTLTGPGGRAERLDAAFARGGPAALVAHVEGLVQVPMDHVVVLDAAGFAALKGLTEGGVSAALTAKDQIDTVLRHMTVDEAFTPDVMRDLALQLAAAGRPMMHVFALRGGDPAHSPELARLRQALRDDAFAGR